MLNRDLVGLFPLSLVASVEWQYFVNHDRSRTFIILISLKKRYNSRLLVGVTLRMNLSAESELLLLKFHFPYNLPYLHQRRIIHKFLSGYELHLPIALNISLTLPRRIALNFLPDQISHIRQLVPPFIFRFQNSKLILLSNHYLLPWLLHNWQIPLLIRTWNSLIVRDSELNHLSSPFGCDGPGDGVRLRH